MRRVLFPAIALFVLAGSPALAQMPVPPAFAEDQVTLSLAAEDWVKTETAQVTLLVDAAGSGAQAGSLRADLIKAARAVSDKGDWRIVRLDRLQDEAGLDRWQAELEARLPEAQLAGLEERAKSASRAGLQVRVAAVAFDPTLTESEAARASLRQRLYAQVTAELERLNASFPGRGFRVGRIDFGEEIVTYEMKRPMMRAESMAPPPAFLPGPVAGGVQDRLKLTARVTLSSFALPPKAP